MCDSYCRRLAASDQREAAHVVQKTGQCHVSACLLIDLQIISLLIDLLLVSLLSSGVFSCVCVCVSRVQVCVLCSAGSGRSLLFGPNRR